MNFTVVGCGYVGMSLSVLLAQKYEVLAFDINKATIKKINNRKSPIEDDEIDNFFRNKKLNLEGVLEANKALSNRDLIIICTPTNFDYDTNSFDTSSVEDTIKQVSQLNIKADIVIKSTIPVGFCDEMQRKYPNVNINFSPEFLREGKALYDNLNPSRIVVGGSSPKLKKFAHILTELSQKKDIQCIFTKNKEAESIKLFSNSFLAMRVAYFNELDSYCREKGLSSSDVVSGVSLDPRIGNYYNNPSFGYGGYCLPKDTQQLLAQYENIPQRMFSAIVEANDVRAKYFAEKVLKGNHSAVGIYRINMKHGSDNYRSSSIFNITNQLKLQKKEINIHIFEPTLIDQEEYDGMKIIREFDQFIDNVDIVLANRIDEKITPYLDKLITPDIYGRD